jgi:thiamine monophosphate synthase
MALLYVVTDEGLSNGLSHTQITELCCQGGTEIVQLRDKDADDDIPPLCQGVQEDL